MKNYRLFLLLPFLPAMLACKKPKSIIPDQTAVINTSLANGMPADIQKINGYLYADINYSNFNNSYSAFSDPAKSLVSTYNHRNNNVQFSQPVLGNIDVGQVSFGGLNLSRQNTGTSVMYEMSNSVGFQNNVWTSDGNGTFKPLSINMARGFPVLNSNTYTFNTISKSSGFTVDIGNSVSNYDSVIVNLTDNYGGLVSKRYTNAGIITFSSNDLVVLNSNSYGSFYVYAYNYANQTINSKVYVFELGNKFSKGVSIIQ
jgi:hypothetical protein